MSPDDDIRLHLVADALRRRWWIIVLLAILLGGGAAAFAHTQASTYTATTTVFLQPLEGNALDSDSTANGQQITIAMETEASLVTSPGVSTLVNKSVGSAVPADAKDLHASVPTNTQTVQISYTADSAKAAHDGAAAYAESFLQFRSDRAEASRDGQVKALEAQAKEVQSKLKEANAAARTKDPSPDAKSQVEIFTTRLSTIQDGIGSARVIATTPGFVVTPANTPTSADGFGSMLLVVAGILAGAAAGAALAIWRERSDDTVRADTDIRVGGVPILAKLPQSLSARPGLISNLNPEEPIHDGYRRARTGMLAQAKRGSVVMISGLRGAEGTGEIAANLGISLASAGYATVLVDAGTGEASQLFAAGEDNGLSEALAAGQLTLPLSERHGMKVLPCGADIPRSRDLFAGQGMRAILDELRGQSDFVLVAGPSALSPESDAVALAADGIILTFDDRDSTHEEVATAVERRAWLGVEVLGVICKREVPHAAMHRALRHDRPDEQQPTDEPPDPDRAPSTGLGNPQHVSR